MIAGSDHFDLNAARDFVRAIPEGEIVGVIMDGDADGLSAGRIFEYTLEKLGKNPRPIFPGKGEWAYSPGTARRVRELDPPSLIIVDTGSSSEEVYSDLRTMVVDHHRPLGLPSCDLYVNSYGRTPKEPSSLIAYCICRELVDLEPIEWATLLGVFGDLGDSKLFPEMDELARRYTKSAVRKAVTLLNSARRSASGDVSAAWEVLKAAVTPREIGEEKTVGSGKLAAARREVNAELERCLREAPRFKGDNAWISISSPCLVHTMLASRWGRTLKDFRVLVSNGGYLPGETVFSLRSRRDENMIIYLEKVASGLKLDGTVGFGHDRATGGRLERASFDKLIGEMGFNPD